MRHGRTVQRIKNHFLSRGFCGALSLLLLALPGGVRADEMDLSIGPLLGRIHEHVINPLIWTLIAIASFVFFWGLFQFVSNADNEEARKKGKSVMVWGIVGLFIMFTALSIIGLALGTAGV